MSRHPRATPKRVVSILVTMVLTAALLPKTQASAAPPRCSPRLQVFFASDFKDQAYQQKAYQKAAAAWKRPAESPKPGGKAVVIVAIGREGKTTPPVLHFKSGSEAWDAAAMAALKAAAPFDPLPKGYRGMTVEVHFHFECAG